MPGRVVVTQTVTPVAVLARTSDGASGRAQQQELAWLAHAWSFGETICTRNARQ